ncbi:hypothetical protein O9993_22770 [Vibrio lentus]|nr:hypothetical protein [Vibrio lentus]
MGLLGQQYDEAGTFIVHGESLTFLTQRRYPVYYAIIATLTNASNIDKNENRCCDYSNDPATHKSIFSR